MPTGPSRLVSVIVPMHNASPYLETTLSAVLSSSYTPFEVIAVDDASSDDSARLCRDKNIEVVSLPRNLGPAAARNEGVKRALGAVLLFLDADVAVRPDTLERIAERFRDVPTIDALFGSYDAAPPQANLVSKYKNLLHHFTHQNASSNASTFWAGCGAIRRNAFESVGGFDAKRYPKSSIEDIELGKRLKKLGFVIRLDRTLQVTHLKRWTWKEWLHTDIFRRAIPWSLLILKDRQIRGDLNLKAADRWSSYLAGLSLLGLITALLHPAFLITTAVGLSLVYTLNSRLYRFFGRQSGWLFGVKSFFLHQLYYLYSGVIFLLCMLYVTVRPGRAS